MITYKYLKNSDIAVYLDNKRVGTIKQFTDGVQYFPKGSKTSDGQIYLSVNECKNCIS